jgi:hypothetical protein
MATAADLTRQGIAAAKRGDLTGAADLFRQATEADPAYQQAWLWRASLATSKKAKRSYLQQVLRANPASEAAMLGLAELGVTITVPPKPAVPSKPAALVVPAVLLLNRSRKSSAISLILLLVLAGVGIVWALGGSVGSGSVSRAPGRLDAWANCQKFVKLKLGSPAAVAFPQSNDPSVTIRHLKIDRIWSALGYVETQNAAGAMLHQGFECRISYSGHSPQLLRMRIGDMWLADYMWDCSEPPGCPQPAARMLDASIMRGLTSDQRDQPAQRRQGWALK